MSVIVNGNEITLTGAVGPDFYEDGFSHGDVVSALAGLNDADEITVRINSGGGIATEGAAIHALLSHRVGRVNVVVEGIAASAASLIAMAGSTVIMAAGALMMIHDPSMITWGTAKAHTKSIEQLDALATAYSRVYASKSRKTADACRKLMQEETWLDPDAAVAAGFADKVQDDGPLTFAAFDYRVYAHAPAALPALAKSRNWTLAAGMIRPQSPQNPPSSKEPTMSQQQNPMKAATARLKAILSSEHAQGRTALAEHLAYETEMDAAAVCAILEKAPAAGSTTMSDADQHELNRLRDQPSRLNGAGLGNQPSTRSRSSAGSGVDLVATMKRRHGVS